MAAPRTSGTFWALGRRIASEGVTFANVWGTLHEHFPDATRADFLTALRAASEALQGRRQLEGRSTNYVPTFDAISQAPVNLPRRYIYTVGVEGLRPGTNDTATVFVNVSSSRRIKLGDAITDAVAQVLTDPENYGVEPMGAAVIDVWRSADA